MADPDYQAQLNAWHASQQKQPFTNNPSGLENNQNPSVIKQLYDQANSYDVNAVGLKTANDQSATAAAQGKYYSTEDWKKAYNDGISQGNSQKSLILGKAVDALVKTSQPDPLPEKVQGELANYDTAIANLHLLQGSYNHALNQSGAIFGGNFKATMGDWIHSNQTNSSVKQFESLKEALTPSIAQGLGYLQGADARPGIQMKIENILPGDTDSLPDANAKLYNLETLALNRKASTLHEYGFGNFQVANQTKETQDQFADLAKRQQSVGQMYDAFNQPSQANPSASPTPTVRGSNSTVTGGLSQQSNNVLNSFLAQKSQSQQQQQPQGQPQQAQVQPSGASGIP